MYFPYFILFSSPLVLIWSSQNGKCFLVLSLHAMIARGTTGPSPAEILLRKQFSDVQATVCQQLCPGFDSLPLSVR
jgi:hypothetical protein